MKLPNTNDNFLNLSSPYGQFKVDFIKQNKKKIKRHVAYLDFYSVMSSDST